MANNQNHIEARQPQPDLARLTNYWETLAMQLNDFNEYNVVSMNGAFYMSLGHAGRRFVQECMKNHVQCEHVFFVRDGNHPDRWFLGPYNDLQHVPGSYISEFNGVPTLVVGTDEPVFPPGPEIYAQMISDNLDLLVSSLDGAQTYESAVAQSTSPVQDSEGLLASTEDASQHSTDVQVNVTKIPRPPNAYILYRRDKQPDVKKANPGIKNNEISVITGDMWNNESRIVRAHYSNLADELKSAFYAKHPDYKYNPRRPEEVKRRAKRNPNNATRIQKKVKGRVGTQRKVLVGELEESDLQIFQSETEAVSGGHSSSSASDEIADKRLATVNVVVANQASLNMQLDINEWNKSISDSQSDLDLDLDNLFDNTDLNSFSPPTAFDFGNPNEFPSVLGNGIDDITF